VSDFTLRWLSKKCKRLINDYGEINLWALAYTDLTSNRRIWSSNLVQADVQAIFFRRRHQPSRLPHAKI
jgi:hypothetical protein